MRTSNDGTLPGGEMGRLMRGHDWAATPLGPPPAWPQSLAVAVRIMLDSRYAMWLGWGSDLTFFYNDAYARMTLGAKHPWALGRSAREVWAEIWPDIGPRAERVLATGEATWDEGLRLFLERGGFTEETYHTFSYSPVPDDAGGIGGLLCVVTEDTERAISDRRLRTLRELAAGTAARTAESVCRIAADTLAANPHDLPFVFLYLIDADGRTARLAGAAGLPPGSPAAPPVVDLTAPAARAADLPLQAVSETGQTEVVTGVGRWFGPGPVGVYPEPPHTAAVLPLRKSGQDRLAGFLVAGVSPRRPFDDSYRGFLDLLAGQVATAVANARAYEEERLRAEALAELDRTKTAFFSNVSHEFRTPLTLILGPVEDALAETDGLSPPQRERLEVAHRNGLRLQRLVNTLLDFSRIEAGRVKATFEPTDLAAFTADLASNFRSACEKAGLTLTVDCPPLDEPVFVDRPMWEKVVLNLLSNAFKFTFDGRIGVSVRRVVHVAEVQVRDTGTGIPAEQMPKLFERFHRVENARGRTHEGSGIGLALVQELVRLHGGTISAESEVGRGTTFTVTLPLGSAHLPPEQVGGIAPAPAPSLATAFVEESLRWLPAADQRADERPDLPPQEEPVPTGRPAGGDRPLVLVADDNWDMRRYVVQLLADQYRVEAVADGVAALEAVRRQVPDLILSDVMMPRLDGFGLLKELRSGPGTATIPVILLSARAGEESRVGGIEAGADDYLVKPFSARELIARVGALLQITRLRRESEQAIRKRSEQLRRLADIATRLNAVLDLRSITGIVTEETRSLIGAHQAVTGFTIDQNWRQAINSVSLSDKYARWRGYDTRPDGSDIYSLVCRTNKPTRLTQEQLEAHPAYLRFGRHAPDHPPMRGWLAAPLVGRDGRNIGLIQLSDKMDGDFTEEDEAILVQLAQMASVAVENAHLVHDLREGDRRKDEFLATLAHELRNPLAPIRSGLQVIRAARCDETVEQARAMMDRQLTHLVRLVDDLLDVSRITRGKIELRKERVAVQAVMEAAVETSHPVIEQAGHELTVAGPDEPVFVDGDPTRLAQVISNLLNNAARYTRKGGHIHLTAVREGGEVRLSVADDGIGIPSEMLGRVFDLFTQVNRSLERTTGGLGIGLSLVKGLVEMHGGTVEARSAGEDQGSEFVIHLPVAEPPRGPAHPARAEQVSPVGRLRILVVDDNEDAADSLGQLLEMQGHETRTAYDGEAGIAAAREFRPEVILMDIGMPKVNGHVAARRIREQPWGREMVLVALTGWGQEDDRQKSEEAGFDFHLVKPVEVTTLTKLLAALRVPRA